MILITWSRVDSGSFSLNGYGMLNDNEECVSENEVYLKQMAVFFFFSRQNVNSPMDAKGLFVETKPYISFLSFIIQYSIQGGAPVR